MSVIFRALRRIEHEALREREGGAPLSLSRTVTQSDVPLSGKSRWLWGVAGVAVFVLLGAAVLFWVGQQRERMAAPPEIAAPLLAPPVVVAPLAPVQPPAPPLPELQAPPHEKNPMAAINQVAPDAVKPDPRTLSSGRVAPPLPAPQPMAVKKPRAEEVALLGEAQERTLNIQVSKGRGGEQRSAGLDSPRGETTEQLMLHLKEAQGAGDEATVSLLLRRLEKRQGRESIFLLKSQAFQLIAQGDLPQAELLLLRALAIKPHDMEAGLNLAVVEFNTGRSREAKSRLEELAQGDPMDARPRQMLRQLFR